MFQAHFTVFQAALLALPPARTAALPRCSSCAAAAGRGRTRTPPGSTSTAPPSRRPELRGGGAAHRGPELAREPAPGTPLYKGTQFGKAADAPS